MTARSYYGQPVIKPPTWKSPDVPAYLYLGGMAGAASTMALLADATGRPALRRAGRIAAAAGATASVGALIHDLGRPQRFLNMLRVLKPTSPLSVGSWILAPFSGLSAATAVSEITGRFSPAACYSGVAAGALGPAMTTYTAVLLADTAVPAWHEAHQRLPFVFAGSAISSAGAVGMLFAPVNQATPARRMAIAGSVVDLAVSRQMISRAGLAGETYEQGRAGTLLRAARKLTYAGLGSAVLARRSRFAAAASGLCFTAAAVATRFGIFEAGQASAREPGYTVTPQRQRMTGASI